MADNTALPPQIILSGKCILEKYIVAELDYYPRANSYRRARGNA
jgi:hypothetical protein